MRHDETYALVHEVLKDNVKGIDVRKESDIGLDVWIEICETKDDEPDMMRVKRLKLIALKCERIKRKITCRYTGGVE